MRRIFENLKGERPDMDEGEFYQLRYDETKAILSGNIKRFFILLDYNLRPMDFPLELRKKTFDILKSDPLIRHCITTIGSDWFKFTYCNRNFTVAKKNY